MSVDSRNSRAAAVPHVTSDMQGVEYWRSGARYGCLEGSDGAEGVLENVFVQAFDTGASHDGPVWLMCCDMCMGAYDNAQIIRTFGTSQILCVLADRSVISVPEQSEACQKLNEQMIQIIRSVNMSETEFLQAAIFMNRIWRFKPEIVSPATLQSLMVGACLLLYKINSDHIHSNYHWAQMLEINAKTLNQIEIVCLSALGFNTFVSTEDFNTIKTAFEQRVCSQQQSETLM
ncbi:MAG: hypothetical protein EZS28_037081 [Streblomastix strix]|uniref:Cyclin N-terminal domain-containing protein n=1 Tax=Streblomastix strix TaxID=222440 RepID=A0A5J4UBZ4_9EUKA|nr:MAG: hypothetical protein EZS28_037081 [Streblomastix strix]